MQDIFCLIKPGERNVVIHFRIIFVCKRNLFPPIKVFGLPQQQGVISRIGSYRIQLGLCNRTIDICLGDIGFQFVLGNSGIEPAYFQLLLLLRFPSGRFGIENIEINIQPCPRIPRSVETHIG
ncbi:hypothetical protein SDC9_173582 [bioreactor metagenome]|uniref:Uncharacterized protein n=1 Tax=bioreactor metagenome TaxID=1076179 RepID=A0A645GGU8_9ZZZZ